MTTEIQTKNYERLDSYIDRIVYHAQEVGDLIQQYMDTAAQEGILEAEAKAYLKSKIPKSTFYKYLPNELKDPNKQNRKPEFGPPVDHTVTEESSSEPVTKCMGVDPGGDTVVSDGNEQESYTPTIDPVETSHDDEHNRLVARIQELEKMVSDLSFQKGSETPPKEVVPPTQQKIRPFKITKEEIPNLYNILGKSLNNDIQAFLLKGTRLHIIPPFSMTYTSETQRNNAQLYEELSLQDAAHQTE